MAAETVAAPYLALPCSPRSSALGDTGGWLDGAESISWNPAGIADSEKVELQFAHDRRFQGLSHETASVAVRLRPGALAAGIGSFGSGTMDAFDAYGGRIGTVSARSWWGRVGWGMRLWRKGPYSVSGGVACGYVAERLADVSAGTLLGDLGGRFSWTLGDKSLIRISACLRNIGPGLRFDRERFPLPSELRLSTSYSRRIFGEPFLAVVEMGMGLRSHFSMGIGVEHRFFETVALRVGFRHPQDIGVGLRAGGGVRLGPADIDYSWSGYGALGDSHRFGLQLSFGKPSGSVRVSIDERRDRARRWMNEGKFHQAIIEWNEVLDRAPLDSEALEQMRRAGENLRGDKQ